LVFIIWLKIAQKDKDVIKHDNNNEESLIFQSGLFIFEVFAIFCLIFLK